MDVGRIIVTQIKRIFYKSRDQLFFSSIVTKWCFNMCLMTSKPEVAVNKVITNQVLQRLLRDFSHLQKVAKTKKRPIKS